MGVVNIIAKIVTLKPVETLISKLLGKVLRQGDGGTKAALGISVGAVVTVIITVAKMVDPGLGDLLGQNTEYITGFVTLVQAIYMYYRREEVL